MINYDKEVKLFRKYFLEQLDLVTPLIEKNLLNMDFNLMYSDLKKDYCFNNKIDKNITTVQELIMNTKKLDIFYRIYSWSPSWTIHVSNYKSLSKSEWNRLQKKALKSDDFSFDVDARGISVIDRTLILMARDMKLENPGIAHEYYNVDNILYERYDLGKEFSQENKINSHCWWPEICVEHENSPKDWLDELIKLVHIQAKIKIVIGYCSVTDRKKAVKGAEIALNMFMQESKIQNVDPIYLFLGPTLCDLESIPTENEKIERIKRHYPLYKFFNHKFELIEGSNSEQ